MMSNHEPLSAVKVHKLSNVIFPFGVHERIIAMFTAYFDESGTHADAPNLAVGGFIAPDSQWSRFQSQWAKILKEEGISFFHMTDWESRLGQFKDWDNEKRVRLYQRLLNVIERIKVTPVVASVGIKSYSDQLPEIRKMVQGAPEHPYAFCALMCLQAVAAWADKVRYDGPIAYIFEGGALHRGELDAIHRRIAKNKDAKQRYRFISLTYADKRDFNPLQGADILAYESYKVIRNRYFEGGARNTRKSFVSLLGKIQSGGERSYPYCRFFREEQLLTSKLYKPPKELSALIKD